MIIHEKSLEAFKSVVESLGAQWSDRSKQSGTLSAIFIHQGTIFNVHASGQAYVVQCADVQALAQVKEVWLATLAKLAKETENE